MRLICTITNRERENPYYFSYYLGLQGIENECQDASDKESFIFRIWVYEEDLVAKAQELYREYQANPHDLRFSSHSQSKPCASEEKMIQSSESDEHQEALPKRRRLLSPAPYGPISIFILLTIVTLFILVQYQRGNIIPPKITGVIQAPHLSPIEKVLIY